MGFKIDFEFFEVEQFYLIFPGKKFFKGISQINFNFRGRNKFIEDFQLKNFIKGFLKLGGGRSWLSLPHYLISASSLYLPRPPTLLVMMMNE